MFKLLCRVKDGQATMISAVSKYLRSVGQMLVQEEASETSRSPVAFIQALLDLKDKYDCFLKNSFRCDTKVKSAIQTVSLGYILSHSTLIGSFSAFNIICICRQFRMSTVNCC